MCGGGILVDFQLRGCYVSCLLQCVNCCCSIMVLICLQCFDALPSVLWCCWLGGRKDIRPVKTEWWSAGMVICLEQGGDLHMAQLMPLPLTVSCFSKIQIGFTFLVPADPGSPGQRAVKRLCVCVFATVCKLLLFSTAGRVWSAGQRAVLSDNNCCVGRSRHSPEPTRQQDGAGYCHRHHRRYRLHGSVAVQSSTVQWCAAAVMGMYDCSNP